jgi:alkaline phosphatase D
VRGPSTEGIGQNSPPPNLHSFGVAEVSKDGELSVRIHDITGEVLFEKVFQPQQ